MANTLLISPDGMLGRAFVRALEARGINHEGLSWPAFDITDPSQVNAAVRPDHQLVINCSAYTEVDAAETNRDAAFAVNARGVGLLARRAAEVGATLVHFSTDYVFDGAATEPYAVDHPHGALGVYGLSKAEGETLVLAAGGPHLLVRTSWLYAPWAKNFVLTMAELGRTREKLRVVDDQRGRPTSAMHLAETTLLLLSRGVRGVAHVTDGGECSWYELAKHVVARVNPACVVEPCTTAEFPRPAPRPAYSVLDIRDTERIVGLMPDWRTHVDRVLVEAGVLPKPTDEEAAQ